MGISSIAINATLTENETAPVQPWMMDEGLIEVERADANDVVVHFRHVDSDVASISAGIDRAGAVALAQALLAAAEADG
jgi:hypothetical protein